MPRQSCAILVLVFEITLMASIALLEGAPGHSVVSFGNRVALLYFLKLCPIFVCSVHNFGRSDDDMI